MRLHENEESARLLDFDAATEHDFAVEDQWGSRSRRTTRLRLCVFMLFLASLVPLSLLSASFLLPDICLDMKPGTLLCSLVGPSAGAAQFTISSSTGDGKHVFDGYVSYSIELSSFPDFAGNNSHPNTFSGNLLENLGRYMGSKPYIRVGGNTQDYALYDASLPYALNGTYDLKRSADYPTTIFIGPSYFESYNTWKDVKFSHGLNLGLGGNSSSGWQSLKNTVPLVCRALGKGKLYAWQYGNEPDLYSTSAQGPVRPPSWDEATYVEQWLNGTRMIKTLIEEHCPELLDSYGYLAPAFGGVGNHLKAPKAWAAGINSDKNIKLFSTHNYISGATSPGVTLQDTLLNHAVTKRSVEAHLAEYTTLHAQDPSAPPLIFGECNSLYNQGRPGLSNTFGATLWAADFLLYSAAAGVKRVHLHMGTDYRYASWQPVATRQTTIGTKAPYYGNIAAAAFLGNPARSPVVVEEIPLPGRGNHEAAYAAFTRDGTTLARLIVLNMHGHNTTVGGAGLVPLPSTPARGAVNYTFAIAGTEPPGRGMVVSIQRLWANGSDAITGITWDGWSYNYELDEGRPVRLSNVTVGETTVIDADGGVTVTVPHSSAVVLDFLARKDGERVQTRRGVKTRGGSFRFGW
ncbi:glycoside hydrolase superfamily [Lasiosphaeria hispida]|uniref:Glycoside hydrolase superfamily n=1 Tax=Lasiosphaeria hispida TaxID=260671 RepID=A0AAJ0M854_9PEZI|nr:glycoside hydrolase superfamily [Lasiosphaeria hispida]